MPDQNKPEEALTPEQDAAIEVNLDKPVDSPAPSSEPKYVSVDELQRVQKQLNGLSYIGRQFQEVSKKLDLLAQGAQPAQRQPSDDPYDELVNKDWKLAVRQLAREEAEAKIREEKENSYKLTLEQQKVNLLEESKKKVMSKYPELEDPSSDLTKKYISILNKNQDYLRNDRGPLLAMRDMEDELRDEGRLDEVTKRVVEKEVNRQVRTGAATLPRSTTNSLGKNTVMLSKEQRELCDNNNIRYEDYGRMLKLSQASGRQGVEV